MERKTPRLPTVDPVLVHRREQHYAGIRKRVRMMDLEVLLSPLIGDVFAWLAKRGLEPAGAPFLRYLIVDLERKLEVDVGIPIAESVPGDGQIITNVLPAGAYAMMLHIGHPAQLEETTSHLFSWAAKKSIRWKMDGSR